MRASQLTKSLIETARQLAERELARIRLLAPNPMSPEQVAELVARARANTTPEAIEGARKQRARNEARRAARGER